MSAAMGISYVVGLLVATILFYMWADEDKRPEIVQRGFGLVVGGMIGVVLGLLLMAVIDAIL